jgi:hypothetical protein
MLRLAEYYIAEWEIVEQKKGWVLWVRVLFMFVTLNSENPAWDISEMQNLV